MAWFGIWVSAESGQQLYYGSFRDGLKNNGKRWSVLWLVYLVIYLVWKEVTQGWNIYGLTD